MSLPRRALRLIDGSPGRRELDRLLHRRWQALAEELKTPQQVSGTAGISCGATHGIMEKCNFACTSCYLSDLANYTRPLPFAEVREQLEALRRHLGPGGKVQLTSGEVTLLPVEELGRLVAYAREIGLDPMVMTNGQRLLQREDYLLRLVAEYGLEKICFHVDTTQKGRPGWRPDMSEGELHPLRERFAELVKGVRRDTGRRLHAAHTVTVTPQNLKDVPQVMRWMLAHAASFRLVSFQPVAGVGRTQDLRTGDLSLEGVWEKVCQGVGRRLNRHAMYFGHPECHITVPLLVLSLGAEREVVEVVRAGKSWDLRVFRKATRQFSRYVDLNRGPGANLRALLRGFLKRPWTLVELGCYGLYRLWGLRGWIGRVLLNPRHGWKIGLRPLFVVVHRFMEADELETSRGKERLDACVFKVPVAGRLVSMCELNASGLRRQLDLEHLKQRRNPA